MAALLALAGCLPRPLYREKRVELQEDAASTHVAVLAVAPFDADSPLRDGGQHLRGLQHGRRAFPGAEPVEVFPTLWDRANPCLLMVRDTSIGAASRHALDDDRRSMRAAFAAEAAWIRAKQRPNKTRAEDLIRADRDDRLR